jgi:polysaccharide biosynthesis protein PslJ
VSQEQRVSHETPRGWCALLALIVLIILYIPIRRYTLPSGLPINLEIYRVAVGLVMLLWLAALLVDPQVRLRSNRLNAPLLLFVLAILVSLLANLHRVDPLRGDVLKAVSFFLSYVLLFWLVLSVLHSSREIDLLARVLAGGGAVLAALALVQTATGYNVFDHLRTALPFLHLNASEIPSNLVRGGGRRAYASAQHPIALGATFCVLLPLAVYQACAYRRRRWWAAAGLMALGILATRSRTPIVMLGAEILVYAVLRPRDVKRLWPAFVPALLAAYIAVPGTIGTVKDSFFPTGGLVAQQENTFVGSGRLATLGPALDREFKPQPLVGEGFGTRITTPDAIVPVPNAPIVDDQWLGVLLETGVFGTVALAWLFLRSLRWLGGETRGDDSPRGWLLASTTAATAGYAVGMLFFDAFEFVQVTFLAFTVLAIGAAAALCPAREWEPVLSGERSRAASRPPDLTRPRGQLA